MKHLKQITLVAAILGTAHFAQAVKVVSKITQKGQTYFFVNAEGVKQELSEKAMKKSAEVIKAAANDGSEVTVYVGKKDINKVEK